MTEVRTPMVPRSIDEVDLNDLDWWGYGGDLHAAFDLLRSQDPVHWHDTEDGWGYWAVTAYRYATDVYLNHETFSSVGGISLRTREQERMAAENPTSSPSMIAIDPPRHGAVRGLINRRFTPRKVAEMEPHIRAIVDKIIDDVAPRGECDFVTDVAGELPTQLICEFMGIPGSDYRRMFDLTNELIGSQDPEYQARHAPGEDTGRAAQLELGAYFAQMIEERRHNPGEDLVSTLVHGDVEGEPMPVPEVIGNLVLLIVGGQETTRNATTAGFIALNENPDQKEALINDRSLMAGAVEEMIRWSAPVTHLVRFATRDTELGGKQIKKGDRVVVWNYAVNFDPEVFDNPKQFDIRRQRNRHLSFAVGEHSCLGMNLARREIELMFDGLLTRVPDMKPSGPPERLRSNFVAGIKHLPVQFEPRPAALTT